MKIKKTKGLPSHQKKTIQGQERSRKKREFLGGLDKPVSRPTATGQKGADRSTQILLPPWGENSMRLGAIVRALASEEMPCKLLGDSDPAWKAIERLQCNLMTNEGIPASMKAFHEIQESAISKGKINNKALKAYSKIAQECGWESNLFKRIKRGDISVVEDIVDTIDLIQLEKPNEDVRRFTNKYLYGNTEAERILLAYIVLDGYGLDPFQTDEAREQRSQLSKLVYGPRTTEYLRIVGPIVRDKLVNERKWILVDDHTVIYRAQCWVRARFVIGMNQFIDEECSIAGKKQETVKRRLYRWFKPFNEAIGYHGKRGRPQKTP